MSIFDNIIFDEFTLLEGKQAEEYKKRKEEEKYNNSDIKYRNTWSGHYDVGQGYKTGGKSKSHHEFIKNSFGRVGDQSTDQEKENNERMLRSTKKADKAIKSRQYGKFNNKNFDGKKDRDIIDNTDHLNAADAINRHERRHPKKESAFEDIDMI